jgi:hypothetical protein
MSEAGGVRAGETAVPVEERLVYQGKVFINFPTSRQWVSMKLFALPPDTDDYTVLTLRIHHVRYRDSYAGTGDKDMENIHGPYWLYAIAPEVFSPVSAADAEALIRTWAEYAVLLTDDDRAAMEREVYPRIQKATGRYQLPDLTDTAQHDWGSSVGNTGFHEFALIDRYAQSVTLLVSSDD